MTPVDGSRLGGMRSRAKALSSRLRDRLSSLRYLAEDGAYAVGRGVRTVAAGLAGAAGRLIAAWRRLDVYTRRRASAAVIAAGAVLLVWLVLIPVAPCQFPGGDSCPPPDEADDLAPAGALGYLHVNLEAGTEQADGARELAAALPTLSAELRTAIADIPGLGLDLGDWFGGEVATVLLAPQGSSGEPRRVVLLEADEEGGAKDLGRQLVGVDPETTEHRGIAIESGDGQAFAVAGGFLIAGEQSAVERVIDVAEGEAPALADDEVADAVRDRLAATRFADGYVSRPGAARLLRPGSGPLAALEPFVNPAAAVAAAGSVSLGDAGVELTIASEQDEQRAEQSPGFFSAFDPFDPELPERLAADTFAYLGLGKPAEGARELIASSAAAAPLLAAGIEGLSRELQQEGRISLFDQVLPLLGEEASLSIGPRGESGTSGVPYLALLTRGVDNEKAEADMARLQGPLADAFGSAGGTFERTEVAGEQAQSLRLSPTVELTYALLEEILVLATQPDAIEAVDGDEDLAGDPGFRDATSDLGGSPVALLYADLEGLIDLGEQAGLAEDPAYAVFAEDLRSLRGLGLLVSRDGTSLTTRIRLLAG